MSFTPPVGAATTTSRGIVKLAADIVVFESIDGRTTWYGSLVGTSFA